jgi:hypothetical protein
MLSVKLLLSPKFMLGAAGGYLLGARAGRAQYDRMIAAARKTNGRLMRRAHDCGVEVMEKVKDKAPFDWDHACDTAPANGRPLHVSGRG